MSTPKRLPSGTWRILVYSHREKNGRKKYISFTGATKAEVMRRAAEFEENRDNNTTIINPTISQAVEAYIQSRNNILSPSTINGYKYIQKKYLTSINNIKVNSITELRLEEFINEISPGLSPKTVRNIYSLVHSSIKKFSKAKFNVTLPETGEIDRNIPIDSDINNLIKHANEKLRLAIVLGSQGLRRGEICSLKYGDILREHNAIYIHSDMVKNQDGTGWVYKPIPKKRASTRKIILPPAVIDMLGTGDDDEFILDYVPDTITKRFIDLRDSLGLKCRFHDLRHYAASIMHSIGVPDVYIMQKGGWGNDKILKSVYRNILADKSEQFNALANNYFENNINLNIDDTEDEK